MCPNLMAGTLYGKKKTTEIWLPNVTSWQKKNVTPNLLQLCDECMEENSQLIMYAN